MLPLPETLVRIEARIAETGLDRSGLLDTQDISRRTALRKSEVEAQLGGSVPPDEPVDDRVRGRVHALHETYPARTGQRTTDVCAEVAAQLGTSPQGARQLPFRKKMPNVPNPIGLARFVGVEHGTMFFTDAASTVLNRELDRVLRELARSPQDSGPFPQLAARHVVVTLDEGTKGR